MINQEKYQGNDVVYYVPTFPMSPTPCIIEQSLKDNKDHKRAMTQKTIDVEFNNLATILKGLGVKSAVYSGAYFKENGSYDDGCVNYAMYYLSKRGITPFRSKVVCPPHGR